MSSQAQVKRVSRSEAAKKLVTLIQKDMAERGIPESEQEERFSQFAKKVATVTAARQRSKA